MAALITIVELRQTVPERFIAKFDDGSELKTTLNTVADMGLYSGKTLTGAEYDAVVAASGKTLCSDRAMHIIGARPMSKKQLYNRLLEKGELAENALATVERFEEIGLINDEAYAAMVVRHYAAKGYGKRRVQNELYRRGVPRDMWDAALEEMPEDEQAQEQIDRLLRRRLKSENPDRAELKKATDALARRGYSWDEIKSAVARFQDGSDDYE